MPPVSSPAPNESNSPSSSTTTAASNLNPHHHASAPTVPSPRHPRDAAHTAVSQLASSASPARLVRPDRFTDGLIHPIAGATAGLISGVFTCPLDVIKTKLQAQGGWMRTQARRTGKQADLTQLRYRGLVGTSRKILSEEGVAGMYRGLGPLIMGYLPTWMVYFTVYENTKATLDPVIQEKWLSHILSAIAGGACSTICTNPIWVIKTRLMSQASTPSSSTTLLNSPYHYTSTLDAFKKMYLHEGLGSFYSGLVPALLGLTHVAVQFPLYEYFKSVFTGGIELGKQGEGGRTHFGGILAASCLSKICASSATYPHEVLRTRLQTQRIMAGHKELSGVERERAFPRYRGVLHSVATIYREEGWRAFYAGMGTNMIRAVPSSAMTLLTYELVVGTLTRWREENTRSSLEHHPPQHPT
ncbi:mitochondrial carrier [Ascodesmis nigricans]|uniref:Mitochondrial carrier n=1 Tax=Ascodesmis nigricans TaxID=341454 RepID=A0A4S2MV32_9PEZI|nr:mitochondrial carrier [Ascodesmis nigricans]